MPKLDDPKREQFARLIVAGMDAYKAHGQAGFRADRGNAIKVKKEPAVATRIAELKEEAAERQALLTGDGSDETGERLLRMAAERALATGNLVALVQAAKAIAEGDLSLDAIRPDKPMTASELMASCEKTSPIMGFIARLVGISDSAERPVPLEKDVAIAGAMLVRFFPPDQLRTLAEGLVDPSVGELLRAKGIPTGGR